MTIEKEGKGVDQTRKILVGIRFDNESKELLGWALVKLARPLDHVVALHVSRNSEDAEREKVLLDDYVDIYNDLCDMKKVKLTGQILTGKSIRKSLVREANDSAAVAVIVGVSKLASIGSWVSTAKYCAKHLPLTTQVLSVHNGKLVFKRSPLDHPPPPGLGGNPKPATNQSEFGDSGVLESDSHCPTMMMGQGSDTDGSGELVANFAIVKSRIEAPLRSGSLCKESSTEQRPGWPLLRRASLPTQRALECRKMSVVQWVMSLPDRSPPDTPQSSSTDSSSAKSETDSPLSRRSSQSVWNELMMLEELGLPFELNSSDFTWFSYEVLNHATSHFSSEKLIGKGGCSRVYKGVFLDGKQVAVKVLKSSKQAWKDFSLEVNIMSSLRHKNITPLLGVCIDNSELISVYDFMSKGSLEENLHVQNNQKCVLSWDARFRAAIRIAEAVNYLHSGCTRPIIHRDIKSSNILLSDDLEPQLSDFGLAIWGPTSSSFETYTDIVGTFGYLAPEYVMYGKVSNKLDVYSFGVVLLEMLSGRKPIDSTKGQESLVIWAKPFLESGKLNEVVDPNLGDNFDESQMQRMVLAATICLTRAARLRPNMGQILRLLKGEETIVETWTKCDENEQEEEEKLDINDDEFYPNSGAEKLKLNWALLNIEDDFTCRSSVQRTHNPCLADLLKDRSSQSLS